MDNKITSMQSKTPKSKSNEVHIVTCHKLINEMKENSIIRTD